MNRICERWAEGGGAVDRRCGHGCLAEGGVEMTAAEDDDSVDVRASEGAYHALADGVVPVHGQGASTPGLGLVLRVDHACSGAGIGFQ